MKRPVANLSMGIFYALVLASCYQSSGGPRDSADRIDINYDLPPDFPSDLSDMDHDMPPDYPIDLPIEELPPITAEAYCEVIALGVCGYFLGCCTPEELDELDPMGVDCEDPLRSEIYRDCMDYPGRPIRSGMIVVDAGGLTLLENELFSLSETCPNFGSSPLTKYYYFRPYVGQALLGQRAAGERCEGEEECLNHLYCNPYDGLCTPRVRPGGVCREENECDLDMVCNRGRCGPVGLDADRCAQYDDCTVGLWCNEDLCVPQLPEGAPCDLEDMSCEGLCSFDYLPTCRSFCDGY